MMQNKAGFLVSILIVVLVALSLELSARHFFISESLIGKKWTQFKSSYLDAPTVVVGACPLAYGFNPEVYSQKVYNLAYLDEEIYYATTFFEKLLSEGSQVKTLIVELDPYLFFSKEYFTVGENDELAHQRIFIRDSIQHLGIKPEAKWTTFDQVLNHSNFLLFKEVYFEKLADCLIHGNCARVENPEMSTSGQLPKTHSFRSTGDYGDQAKLELMKSEISRDINVSMDKANGQRNLESLAKLARLAAQHGVRVIMVNPPFYSEFKKYFYEKLPQDYLAFYNESLKTLSENKNVKMIDLQNMFDQNPKEREYFFDLIHVNKEGSVLFTKKIEEMIRNIE